MPSENLHLTFAYHNIGQWTIPTLELPESGSAYLNLPIMGYIANSIPTSQAGKKRLDNWKVSVASEAKTVRGQQAWNPQVQYAIAISFSFNPQLHGNRRRSDGQVHLDVETGQSHLILSEIRGQMSQTTDIRRMGEDLAEQILGWVIHSVQHGKLEWNNC